MDGGIEENITAEFSLKQYRGGLDNFEQQRPERMAGQNSLNSIVWFSIELGI